MSSTEKDNEFNACLSGITKLLRLIIFHEIETRINETINLLFVYFLC